MRRWQYREVLEAARQASSYDEAFEKLAPPRGPIGSEANLLRAGVAMMLRRAWAELGRPRDGIVVRRP